MPAPTQPPIIDEEADRLLGRIVIRYGIVVFLLLVLTTFFLSFANAQLHPKTLGDLLKPRLVLLNGISILIVLIPFFAGINRVFAARLRIGRERVQSRSWRAAVAALEPFTSRSQRFQDSTGEAHYLLAQAYTALGEKAKAEAARTFVRRNRKGVWAEKLGGGKGTATTALPEQEKRPRPPKGKPRRRF